MADARRVAVLVTGGHTIATDELLEKTRGLPPDVALEVQQYVQTPSHAFSPVEMQRIALRARDLARDRGSAGVVVVHGTATIEYTSFLTELYLDQDAHAVFMGPTPGGDWPTDLRDAVLLTLEPRAAGYGAMLCFGGQVIAARDAWKLERRVANPFISLGPMLGSVSGGRVSLGARPRRPRTLAGELEPAVVLIKAHPGANGDAITAAVRAGVKGIVLEGYPGVGPVPPEMIPALREATAKGVAVVSSSRAPKGVIPTPPSGGTGDPFHGIPMLSGGALTAEQSFMLLMAALGEASDARAVAAIFASANGSEI